jgi:glucan biosynthesis protein
MPARCAGPRVPARDVGRLGIAPLTSMFLFGPNQQSSRRNFRPAIHDSNGWRSTPAMASGCGVR